MPWRIAVPLRLPVCRRPPVAARPYRHPPATACLCRPVATLSSRPASFLHQFVAVRSTLTLTRNAIPLFRPAAMYVAADTDSPHVCLRRPAAVRLFRALAMVTIAFVAGALSPPALGALDSVVDIRALSNFYSAPLSEWHWNGTVESVLDLRSERNSVVRGQLQLETTLLTSGLGVDDMGIPASALALACSGVSADGRLCFDVPRANIRVRIPISDDYRIRFTIGRARLTWGQGQVFNAGDLLFGADPDQVDYTEVAIRDETAVLVASFIPLTDFSFIEVVGLPPLTTLTDAPIGEGAGGLRLQGKIADLKYEIGYLFDGGSADGAAGNAAGNTDSPSDAAGNTDSPSDAAGNTDGDDPAHNIAISVQGNVGADFYLSATSALVHNVDVADELYQRLQITLGLNYIIDLTGDLNLSLRLESLWRPAGEWQEKDGATVRYALLLYPEVLLSISNAVQIFVRSIFSPIDLSAQLIGGVTWVPHSGLSLLFFPTINIGESSDTYHIDQTGGLRFTVGAQYTF